MSGQWSCVYILVTFSLACTYSYRGHSSNRNIFTWQVLGKLDKSELVLDEQNFTRSGHVTGTVNAVAMKGRLNRPTFLFYNIGWNGSAYTPYTFNYCLAPSKLVK